MGVSARGGSLCWELLEDPPVGAGVWALRSGQTKLDGGGGKGMLAMLDLGGGGLAVTLLCQFSAAFKPAHTCMRPSRV